MKKYFILYGLPVIIITILCLYPIGEDVTINKKEIEGNYPFAGELKLNGEKTFVTTKVATSYWVDYDNQPDVQNIRTTRYGLIGYLFGVGVAR
jgi:hypothetical protein